MLLRVAGAQIPVTESIRSNLEAINSAVDFAIDEEADILLTPEGSLSGYTHRFDQKEVAKGLSAIMTRTRGKLGLALGTCYFEEDGLCYDQVRFYDTRGKSLGFHSKILLCSTLTEPLEGEIEHYATKPLRTFRFKRATVGGLVCNDMWANPCYTSMPDSHLSQELARMGARVIFHAVNGGRDKSEFSQVARNFHESSLRLRAAAGKIWIVTADNCFPEDIPSSCPSGIVDPHGNWIVKIPDKGKQFFACTIEI
jgi:predicted amidohydrolase